MKHASPLSIKALQNLLDQKQNKLPPTRVILSKTKTCFAMLSAMFVQSAVLLNLIGHLLILAYCYALNAQVFTVILVCTFQSVDETNAISTIITKPCAKDAFSHKEKYIHAKYKDKSLIIRDALQAGDPPYSRTIWQAVKADNLQEVYRLIAISETNIVNTIFDDVVSIELYHHVVDAQDSSLESHKEEKEQHDPSSCQRIKDSNDPGNCLQGCSLLHLACQGGNLVMLELLLQFGADINMQDFHGRTPLHHCISLGNNSLAKHLLRRGARSSIIDHSGLTAVERAMEKGAINDEELFILLSES